VSYFFARLEALVASLSPEGLLEQLIVANEAIVFGQARREHSVATEIACFSSVARMVERLEEEIPESTKAALSTRFLIEYIAARPPSGIRPLSMTVFDELLALGSEIFNKGVASDHIHHGIGDIEVSILESRRLGFNRDTPFEQGRSAYLNLHARTEIARRTRGFERLWRDEPAERPEALDKLDAAVKAEFGFTFTEIVSFHSALLGAGAEGQEPSKRRVNELVEELAAGLEWEPEKVERAIELHALRQRETFLDPQGLGWPAVVPWLFNRPLSYIRRPLLIREAPDGDEVIWGTRHLHAASRYFFDLCAGGRLDAQSPQMKKMLSQWRAQDARAFNDAVADLFRGEHTLVDLRVTRFSSLKIERVPGQQLTDIDVLVIEPRKRRIRVIETKALAPGRTPRELAFERKQTFFPEGEKRSEVQKLIDARDWVSDHLPEVLAHYDIDPKNSLKRWRVVPLMVVEAELLTPFVADLPVEVTTIHELQERRAS
jgi:hypothetical protein